MWTETAKDKQRRDPTVGSKGGGESNSPNSQPSEDPGADHQKQEEIPQSDQPRGGESDSPGGKPSEDPIGSIGQRQVQVDSRERKLSRVKTGTKQVLEGQSTVIKVLGGSVNQIQRYHLRINSPFKWHRKPGRGANTGTGHARCTPQPHQNSAPKPEQSPTNAPANYSPPDPPRPLRTATELGVTHPVTRRYF